MYIKTWRELFNVVIFGDFKIEIIKTASFGRLFAFIDTNPYQEACDSCRDPDDS